MNSLTQGELLEVCSWTRSNLLNLSSNNDLVSYIALTLMKSLSMEGHDQRPLKPNKL